MSEKLPDNCPACGQDISAWNYCPCGWLPPENKPTMSEKLPALWCPTIEGELIIDSEAAVNAYADRDASTDELYIPAAALRELAMKWLNANEVSGCYGATILDLLADYETSTKRENIDTSAGNVDAVDDRSDILPRDRTTRSFFRDEPEGEP